jgi:hypothetical protein
VFILSCRALLELEKRRVIFDITRCTAARLYLNIYFRPLHCSNRTHAHHSQKSPNFDFSTPTRTSNANEKRCFRNVAPSRNNAAFVSVFIYSLGPIKYLFWAYPSCCPVRSDTKSCIIHLTTARKIQNSGAIINP